MPSYGTLRLSQGTPPDGDDDQIFGQAKPVKRQNGWRHLLVECRLLTLGGAAFRTAIARERASGMKTEPAFAIVLRPTGDPYRALLDLERTDDGPPSDLLKAAGFDGA